MAARITGVVSRLSVLAMTGVLVTTGALSLPVHDRAVVAIGATAADIDGSAGRRPVRTVAVIGDSISQGTGSDGPGAPGGGIGEPRPAASWATGDQPGLDSYADRLDALIGDPVTRINLSENGASMRSDFYAQATAVPSDADLVLIQMGGNDLCRPSEAEITSPEVFEREFIRGLDWLVEHRPDTLIAVGSVPDVYSLWYVRGAPHVGEQWPVLDLVLDGRAGPRPARTAAENDNKRWARLLWNTLGMVPCASLLEAANRPTNAGPTPDPTDPAEARRLRVRAINQRYNEILEQRCAAVLRCRFDGGAVFDLMANRDRDGELLGDPAQWTFTDTDISTQDHFHPSFAGQAKLAEAMWTSGFDFTDTTGPTVQVRSRGVGTLTEPVSYLAAARSVRAIASDDRGVRGLEYRSAPLGEALSARPWESAFGGSAEIEIAGDTELEVRAVDVNGNVSDSAVTRFVVDAEAPSLEIVLAPAATTRSPHDHLDAMPVVLNESRVATARCDDHASGVARCELDSGERRRMLDTSQVGSFEVSATATDRVGNRASYTARYATVYRWSSPWLSSAQSPARSSDGESGRVVVVRVGLSDADGVAVDDAAVTLSLIDPEGRTVAVPSPFGTVGLDRLTWSETLGEYIAVVGTATLPAGEWTLVVEADDRGRLERSLTVG